MSLIHTCYRITDIDRSVGFYQTLGFNEIGRRVNYYPARKGREDAIVMGLEK